MNDTPSEEEQEIEAFREALKGLGSKRELSPDFHQRLIQKMQELSLDAYKNLKEVEEVNKERVDILINVLRNFKFSSEMNTESRKEPPSVVRKRKIMEKNARELELKRLRGQSA